MAWITGVDVGGTFTDLIALETQTGEVRLAKVPTTIDNQAFGVLAALEEARLALADVAMLVHGTTTTTNALLERRLARTGLITTKGFRDVLELGRRTRNDLKLGICGEHGGEPGAVAFCDRLGMNYVSCSPFRVPIARLAAAQAALAARGTMDRTRATV